MVTFSTYQYYEVLSLSKKIDIATKNITTLDANDKVNKNEFKRHMNNFVENRKIISNSLNKIEKNLDSEVIKLTAQINQLEPSLRTALEETKDSLSLEIRSIPKGDKGDRGFTGPIGPRGPQGIAGGMTPTQEKKLNNVITDVNNITGTYWSSYFDKDLDEINDCLDGIESVMRNLGSYIKTYTSSQNVSHARVSGYSGGVYSTTTYVGPYVSSLYVSSIYPSGC